MNMKKHYQQSDGFTLVEIAIVLVIIGLLLAAFLTPLTAQFEQKRVNEAREDLAEIKQSLLGFASVNLSLPCPDTTGDGIADPCTGALNNTVSSGGNVPWVTLGIKPTDPWDRRYQYRVNNAFTVAPITLNTTANALQSRICTSNACAALEANGVPAVIYSSGANGAIQPPVGVDELQNTAVAGANFDGTFVNHAFATAGSPNGQFDDVMDWISTNVLMGQLVAAGQLP
jgi:prepilin-type N-terminal cleavage/methylation domain-containing protein